MTIKPKKKTDKELNQLILECIDKKAYVISKHAKARQKERAISDLDIINLLEDKQKRRNKKKDKYEDGHQDWNYCYESEDHDDNTIRVILSFNDEYMLIITVIRLIN